MADTKCSLFFEEFILTQGKNILLCENNLDNQKNNRITCYNSKLNKICEYNTSKTEQFHYLEKMKIDKNKFNIFYNFYNPIEETKLTINIVKLF